MPTSAEQNILVNSGDYPAREGVLQTRVFSQAERASRAALAWISFWVLAVLSVPIIGAHWVLVPGFLIAGPWAAWRRLRTLAVSDRATGTCPVHGGVFTLDLEAGDRLPIWKPCPECHAPLHLVDALVDNTRSENS